MKSTSPASELSSEASGVPAGASGVAPSSSQEAAALGGEVTPRDIDIPHEVDTAAKPAHVIKTGLHSLEVSQHLQKKSYQMAEENNKSVPQSINAWSVARRLELAGLAVQMDDCTAFPPRVPVSPPAFLGLPADWRFIITQDSDGSDGYCTQWQHMFDQHVQMLCPANNGAAVPANYARVPTVVDFRPSRAVGPQLDLRESLANLAGGSALGLESKSVSGVLNALLPVHAWNRATETLMNALCTRAPNTRFENRALYFRLAIDYFNCAVSEVAGLATVLPATLVAQADIDGHDYSDPNVQQAARLAFDGWMDTGTMVIRVNTDLSKDECDLLVSLLQTPDRIAQPAGAADPIPLVGMATIPTIKVGFLHSGGAALPNPIAGVPLADAVWHLMLNLATIRNESTDLVEGLALASEFLVSRLILRNFPGDPAGTVTPMRADSSHSFASLPAPKSISPIILWNPAQDTTRDDARLELKSLLHDGFREVLVRSAIVGTMVAAASMTALKSLNLEGYMYGKLHEVNLGRTYPINPTEAMLCGASRNPFRPSPGKDRCYVYNAIGGLLLGMYGVHYPIRAHDGQVLGGEAKLAPMPPAGGANPSMVLNFDDETFPHVVDPMCTLSWLLPDGVPREWGICASYQQANWRREIVQGAGPDAGFQFWRGMKWEYKDWGTAWAAMHRSYSLRCVNAVSLWMNGNPGIRRWWMRRSPEIDVTQWMPDAVNWVHPRYPGAHHLPITVGKTIDWIQQRILTYNLPQPGRSALAGFQYGPVARHHNNWTFRWYCLQVNEGLAPTAATDDGFDI